MRATPGRKPGVVAAESGKHPRQPDEGQPEFTQIQNFLKGAAEDSVSALSSFIANALNEL